MAKSLLKEKLASKTKSHRQINMATAPNNDTEPKGFSGLSSLVSDISKDIANANQCPNCGYVIEGCGQKCQKCGIIFAKYKVSAVTRTPLQTQQESASNSSNITTSSVEKNDEIQDLKAWADSIIAEARGQGEKGAKAEVEKKTSSRIQRNLRRAHFSLLVTLIDLVGGGDD